MKECGVRVGMAVGGREGGGGADDGEQRAIGALTVQGLITAHCCCCWHRCWPALLPQPLLPLPALSAP